MTKITLSQPDGPHHTDIDTDVMDVTIRDAFLGVQFVTVDGEHLAVLMRDGGYEVHYWSPQPEGLNAGFDAGWTRFVGGEVRGRLTDDQHEHTLRLTAMLDRLADLAIWMSGANAFGPGGAGEAEWQRRRDSDLRNALELLGRSTDYRRPPFVGPEDHDDDGIRHACVMPAGFDMTTGATVGFSPGDTWTCVCGDEWLYRQRHNRRGTDEPKYGWARIRDLTAEAEAGYDPEALRVRSSETYRCGNCHEPLPIGSLSCRHCGASDADE